MSDSRAEIHLMSSARSSRATHRNQSPQPPDLLVFPQVAVWIPVIRFRAEMLGFSLSRPQNILDAHMYGAEHLQTVKVGTARDLFGVQCVMLESPLHGLLRLRFSP